MTHTDAVDKVRKILRLADKAGTPEEAAAAMSRAQALIDTYKLESTMIEADETAQPDEPIEDYGRKFAPLDSQKQLIRWRYWLASSVAKANACETYASGGWTHIVGRASDVETVRYLFGYIVKQAEDLIDTNGRGCGKTWRNNFALGIVDTVGRKLRVSKDAWKKDVAAAALLSDSTGLTSTALVRTNQALVKMEQRGLATLSWTKTNMKLRKGSSSNSRYDHSARAAGRVAGESVSLGGRARAVLN